MASHFLPAGLSFSSALGRPSLLRGGPHRQVQSKIREIFMPTLSSTMTKGKIVWWVKSEGDVLSKCKSVVVVEFDKANDVKTFYDGFCLRHFAFLLKLFGWRCLRGIEEINGEERNDEERKSEERNRTVAAAKPLKIRTGNRNQRFCTTTQDQNLHLAASTKPSHCAMNSGHSAPCSSAPFRRTTPPSSHLPPTCFLPRLENATIVGGYLLRDPQQQPLPFSVSFDSLSLGNFGMNSSKAPTTNCWKGSGDGARNKEAETVGRYHLPKKFAARERSRR